MITYFIQVSLIWIALYLVYATMLHRETFFNTNRLYLLLSLATGILVPLLVPILSFETGTATVPLGTYVATMSEIIIRPEILEKPWYGDTAQLILSVYLLGIVLLGLKFSAGLMYIWNIYRKSIKETKGDYTLVTTNGRHQPFSFFGYVFVSKNDLNNPNLNEIIKHEIIHINEGHSFDIISVEVLTILFWFNPVLWFYKKSLRATHEYMADNGMINNYSKEKYSLLLLGYTSSGDDVALVNPFFNSLIKKRIQMMYAKKSETSAKIKYFAALPIVTFLTLSLATYDVNGQTITQTIEEKLTKIVSSTVTDTIVTYDETNSKTNGEESIKIVSKTITDTIKPEFPKDILMIVDETIWDNQKNLNPDDISTINVLKGEEALKKYGEKGRKGVVEIITKNKTSNFVEAPDTQPRFPGSTSAEDHQNKLFAFLANNIKYPESARKYGVEGKVVVSFIVIADDFLMNPKGDITDIKILRGISPDCDAEVIRVIEKMRDEFGQWIPATKNGEFVNARQVLPVNFQLQSHFEPKKLALENLDISYYPNPATDYIMVDVKGNQGTTNIQLHDLSGKIIKSLNAQGEGLQELNTSDLPAGEYILNVSKDKSSISEKVLIVR